MSTKGKNSKKGVETPLEKPQVHLDPNQYGYGKGQKAPFEGNLILQAVGVLHAFAIKEQTVVYEHKDSFDETVKTGKTQITEMGVQAMRLVEMLIGGHLENADEGIAIHQSVLMQQFAPQPTAAPEFDINVKDAENVGDTEPQPEPESEK